jgi:hypothetical protein
MKTMVALVSGLSLMVGTAGTALAQSDGYVPPPGAEQQAPPPQAPGAPQYAPPQVVPQSAGGEWQYIDGQGWVWVPAGATTYNIASTPYVYLYTPVYGWTWYVSPWGWGPYYRGGWIHRPFWGGGAWGHYYGGHPVFGGGHYGGGAHYGGGHYGGGARGGAHYGGGGHAGGHGGGRR